jgi:Ca2+-binding EF-hand superfamily protein
MARRVLLLWCFATLGRTQADDELGRTQADDDVRNYTDAEVSAASALARGVVSSSAAGSIGAAELFASLTDRMRGSDVVDPLPDGATVCGYRVPGSNSEEAAPPDAAPDDNDDNVVAWIESSVTFDMDFSLLSTLTGRGRVRRMEFEGDVREALSDTLGVAIGQVVIDRIYAGSVVVEWHLEVPLAVADSFGVYTVQNMISSGEPITISLGGEEYAAPTATMASPSKREVDLAALAEGTDDAAASTPRGTAAPHEPSTGIPPAMIVIIALLLAGGLVNICWGRVVRQREKELAKEKRARASQELKEARLKRPALTFGTAAATPGSKKVVFGANRSLGLRLGSDDPLDQLWLKVDQDGDGELDRGEVLQLLQMMGRADAEAQVDGVMEELDADGSGDIDLGEFEDWYRRQPDGHVRAADALAPVRIESIGAYAAKRGLRPGMRILSLQGHDTRAMTLRDVTKLLEQAGRPLTMEFDKTTMWQPGKPGAAAAKPGGGGGAGEAPSAVGTDEAGKQLTKIQVRGMVRIQLQMLGRIVEDADVSDAWIDGMFEDFDDDGSGLIDDSEWEQLVAVLTDMKLLGKAQVRQMYRIQLEMDGRGEDASAAATSDAEIDALFDEFDADGSGLIDDDEWDQLLRKMRGEDLAAAAAATTAADGGEEGDSDDKDDEDDDSDEDEDDDSDEDEEQGQEPTRGARAEAQAAHAARVASLEARP